MKAILIAAAVLIHVGATTIILACCKISGDCADREGLPRLPVRPAAPAPRPQGSPAERQLGRHWQWVKIFKKHTSKIAIFVL